jgi:hypothetical protein
MEAYETAKAEIEGENTVFQDVAEWWNRVLSFRRSNDTVTKYASDVKGTAFDGQVSYFSVCCLFGCPCYNLPPLYGSSAL